ncbi:AMP-dependent synthetase/ligase [Rubrolithibacter danxiaensis]|uniref:AMP-dependent synthetase/ligase n=1 Tax=Rubrolithibacter danxiaensis TaxID=3390805 RepID=UPI003BF91137
MTSIKEPATIPQLLRRVVEEIHNENHTFMREKVGDNWEDISYKQTLDNADAIASYFIETGIQKGDRLALLIENSPEYIYYDQALQQIGAVNVSIYPTLSEVEIQHILNDSGSRMILVGNTFLLKRILKIADSCPALTTIIPAFEGYARIIENAQITARIIDFKELIHIGKFKLEVNKQEIEKKRSEVLPTDLASLIYTSGTTGTPKGVMLTHYNFIENVKVSLQQIPVIVKSDIFLSFLPLSHVFERTATYHICSYTGAQIAFAQSLELLARNMLEIKPHILIAVPRLLERINDKAVKNGTSGGGTKAKIFLWSLEIGRKFRETKEAGKTAGLILSLQHKLADKLVFSKIREKTGGRLKLIVSGGGALPKSVGEFFGDIGIKVLEGFGLTETSPVMAVTEFDRQVYGTVGRVIPGLEVGIQDVETKEIYTIQTHNSFDKNYESKEGEIIVRGHCVMKGYWNKPEETAQVIDPEGWFHTGDIGRFYKGYLQITDRLKNMLVNSFGKNVYPTPIENAYLKSQKIEQIFLIGDKREYITAIIVPSKESLQEEFGLKEDFFAREKAFIENKDIINWIAEDVKLLSADLAKFERIRHFIVKRVPFSIESGEMTPTLKIKRKVVEKKYENVIDEMYRREIDSE